MVCHASVHPHLIGEEGFNSRVNERNPERNRESPWLPKATGKMEQIRVLKNKGLGQFAKRKDTVRKKDTENSA
jgi:hypothetical protein